MTCSPLGVYTCVRHTWLYVFVSFSDGEMVIYNRNELIIHSKGDSFDVKSIQANDCQLQPCLILFDILMYNDEILTNKPLNERLHYLHKKILEPIDGRVMFSTIKPGTSNHDVINELNLAIEERQEGIVVKDPWSVYKPNVRENGGWYKASTRVLKREREISRMIRRMLFNLNRTSS
jgi:DNA ligase 4